MKHRLLVTMTAALLACGGRAPAVTQPVPGGTDRQAPPPTQPPASAPVTASTPPPAAAPKIDTAARKSLKQALDSVADALALDSLSKLQAAASLPEVPIDAHPTWDLNVASFADQPRVKYYLDYFTGRSRERFQVWLDRMGRFESYAREQFTARKLPGDFVYLAIVESGFSPNAVSRASAVGMWQFMVATGRAYGLRVDTWVDERRDPLKSTTAAAHHLDDLTQRFGSHYLAAAAYNAGAGRVGRSLSQMGSIDAPEDDSLNVVADGAFFSLADTRLIRDETKNYVPQLIAAAIIAKEPNKYGFDAPSDITPFSRDSVMVDGGTGLDLIARLADTSLDALRELNPHLLRLVTPPGAPYPVRVPSGKAGHIADAYRALPSDQRVAITSHEVRKGETVASLSKRFGVSTDMIKSANRAARGKSLPPGTMLYLPVSTTISEELLREPDPPRVTRTTVRTVTVRAGESISSVARRAGVSVSSLRADNGLGAKTKLRAGQRLVARRTVTVKSSSSKSKAKSGTSTKRATTASAEPVSPTTPVRTHVVKKGETITAIAQRFGIKPALLLAVNGLGKGGTVKAGQTLRIPHG